MENKHCQICGKFLKKVEQKYCRFCRKLMKEVIGLGHHLINKCKDCGKLNDNRAIRCHSCENKRNPHNPMGIRGYK
jgi:hypothetical protein